MRIVFGGIDAGSTSPVSTVPADSSVGDNSMTNVAPPLEGLFSVKVPPCCSMRFRHNESPSPVPSPAGFVVKNGSNTFPWMSAGIPGPLSVISTWIRPWPRSNLLMIEIRFGPLTFRIA